MNWAHRKHAVTQFIVSISPDNTASQALANSLGFRKVGEWVDEEDGLEEVFLLDIREKTPESE